MALARHRRLVLSLRGYHSKYEFHQGGRREEKSFRSQLCLSQRLVFYLPVGGKCSSWQPGLFLFFILQPEVGYLNPREPSYCQIIEGPLSSMKL